MWWIPNGEMLYNDFPKLTKPKGHQYTKQKYFQIALAAKMRPSEPGEMRDPHAWYTTTYTGHGSADREIAHGMSAAPSFVWIRNRDK